MPDNKLLEVWILMLDLFYITNDLQVALIAEKYGVDRIWIDLETLGKEERQKGMNTVKSCHTAADIAKIKPHLTKAEMMVRVNPWNENSAKEIEQVIAAGADVIMLPMWKQPADVDNFLKAVHNRAKTSLLLETKEALYCVDEVLKMKFDEIHIGLNDLHLALGQTFMFQLLADGTVEGLCNKFKAKGVPYGFGGIARLGYGLLPAEQVILEHYRLGSTRAILSRSFCNTDECESIADVEKLFCENMKSLREYEEYCSKADTKAFEENKKQVAVNVDRVVEILRQKK